MIITPQELQQWKDEGKSFTVIDLRPAEQREEFPLDGLRSVIAELGSIPITESESVLICQFGIVTEGIIIERELKNAFSLLGGVQAWNAYQSEKEDLSRWSRQTVLPNIGLEGQKKLLNATVGVVGMGGLGCPASQSLIAAGIGKLKIIDGDNVELSNLHRQPLYGVEDIGRMKVQAAKEKLEKLNRDAIVEIVDVFINDDNGLNFISDVDIVIDATDNIPARLLVDRFHGGFMAVSWPVSYFGLVLSAT